MNDKYIFETESEREMRLVTNRHKYNLALSELKDWYIKVLNYKDEEECKYLVQGKMFSFEETISKNFAKKNNLEKDERGLIKDFQPIYLREDILRKIEFILDGIFDMVE